MAWENSDDFSESGVDCGPDLRKTVCRIRSDPKGEIRRCLRAVVLDRWIERQCLRIQVNLESWLWLANFGVLDCSIEFLRRRGEEREVKEDFRREMESVPSVLLTLYAFYFIFQQAE